MIPIAWLGIVYAIIALMFAGLRGDIVLGILAATVGCYSWAVLGKAIDDRDYWDDE